MDSIPISIIYAVLQFIYSLNSKQVCRKSDYDKAFDK